MEFTDHLTADHVSMIERQPVFFVATAAADGRINLSPKGLDSFRVLGANRVAYLDLGGSGNETHAHLSAAQTDQGRITVMMCNFEQPALILRIYGIGRAVLPQDAAWAELSAHFELLPGTPLMSRDNLDSMKEDNVVDPAIQALTAATLGIKLTALEAVAPGYLSPAEPFDQFRARAGR